MSIKLLTLTLLLTGCFASQDEDEIDFMNVQVGGRATLNCESSADKWTFTKNDSTEIINAGEKSKHIYICMHVYKYIHMFIIYLCLPKFQGEQLSSLSMTISYV